MTAKRQASTSNSFGVNLPATSRDRALPASLLLLLLHPLDHQPATREWRHGKEAARARPPPLPWRGGDALPLRAHHGTVPHGAAPPPSGRIRRSGAVIHPVRRRRSADACVRVPISSCGSSCTQSCKTHTFRARSLLSIFASFFGLVLLGPSLAAR